MWIDTHCHLDFEVFTSPEGEGEKVLARAHEEGVTRLINVGVTLESSMSGLALARKVDSMFCTVGIHPNEASTWSPAVEAGLVSMMAEDRMSVLAGGRRIVAMGEIGLDYFRKGAELEVQREVFRQQIRLAEREDLPIMVHCRDAFEDALTIMEEENVRRAVFHCFTGDLSVARRVWEHDWFTSFSAVVSYPKNDALREVLRLAPRGRFFLETDAPFLPYQSLRGQRNEPAFIPLLGALVAQVRGESVQDVAVTTTTAAVDFFGLGR